MPTKPIIMEKKERKTFNKESKLYKVSNRNRQILAIFATRDKAREFATAFRAAYNLKLPNDVRINVNYVD